MFEKEFYTPNSVVHSISMNIKLKKYDKGNRNY